MKVEIIYGLRKKHHINLLLFAKYYNSIPSQTLLNNFQIGSFT